MLKNAFPAKSFPAYYFTVLILSQCYEVVIAALHMGKVALVRLTKILSFKKEKYINRKKLNL